MFAIKNIKVSGNKMIKKDGVLDPKVVLGNNIFLLDTNEVRGKILENPYIQTVEVKRSIPDGIDVKVVERKMFYKIKLDEKIYVLNNELYIMDIIDDDKELALVEIEGIKADSIMVGERITKSDELSKIAFELAENLIDKNKESIFSKIDLSEPNDVSIYKGKIEIILGEVDNLAEKYEKAMVILNSGKVGLKEGYIDISVPNQPVIKSSLEETDENKEAVDENKEAVEDIKVEDAVQESEKQENDTPSETNVAPTPEQQLEQGPQ